MMQVQVTCRFCHRKFEPVHSYTDPDIDNGRPYYECECQPCRSTQYFESSGRALHYWFKVGNYKLYFMPYTYITPKFQLSKLEPFDIILELNFFPHNLTPQTCNEERIKTLILFS